MTHEWRDLFAMAKFIVISCRLNPPNVVRALTLEMRGKAHRVARPAQTRLQNSGITRSKFTKFLSDVEGSSAVLTRASMSCCDPPVRCGMPAHRRKVRCANFRRFAPKIYEMFTTVCVSLCVQPSCTQQFWLFSVLTYRQSSKLKFCLLEGRANLSWKYGEDRSSTVTEIIGFQGNR